MIDVLNLNHRELIAERSALIEQLDGELEEGVFPSQLLNSFLYICPGGTRVSFANVAIVYLRSQQDSVQQV